MARVKRHHSQVKTWPQYSMGKRDIMHNQYKRYAGTADAAGFPLETIQSIRLDVEATGQLEYLPKWVGLETGVHWVPFEGDSRATLLLQMMRNISLDLYPEEADFFWTLYDDLRAGTLPKGALKDLLYSGMCGSKSRRIEGRICSVSTFICFDNIVKDWEDTDPQTVSRRVVVAREELKTWMCTQDVRWQRATLDLESLQFGRRCAAVAATNRSFRVLSEALRKQIWDDSKDGMDTGSDSSDSESDNGGSTDWC